MTHYERLQSPTDILLWSHLDTGRTRSGWHVSISAVRCRGFSVSSMVLTGSDASPPFFLAGICSPHWEPMCFSTLYSEDFRQRCALTKISCPVGVSCTQAADFYYFHYFCRSQGVPWAEGPHPEWFLSQWEMIFLQTACCDHGCFLTKLFFHQSMIRRWLLRAARAPLFMHSMVLRPITCFGASMQIRWATGSHMSVHPGYSDAQKDHSRQCIVFLLTTKAVVAVPISVTINGTGSSFNPTQRLPQDPRPAASGLSIMMFRFS